MPLMRIPEPTLLETFTSKSLRPTWAILALSLGATALATWATHRTVTITAARQFELETSIAADTIKDVMRNYEQVLRGGAALFAVDRNVTREEWSRFVSALELPRTFPGVQGIGFSKLIDKSELADHIAWERRNGRPDYDVWPSGARNPYSSIVFLEPPDARNNAAIGYDMYSEPVRREAMQAARTSGAPRMSRKVTLAQEIDSNVQPGVLVYMPVVTPEAAGAKGIDATESGGTAQQDGFVYAAFRLHDLFDRSLPGLIPKSLERMDLRIYGTPDAADSELLYRSASGPVRQAPYETKRTLEVSGQTWTLKTSSQPAFESSVPWWQPWVVAAAGGLISALISSIAGALALSRDRALFAKEALSVEVAERKRAQERERISNRELIHRVKNMMAVVASIAQQTARYTPNPAEFNVVFRERLAALGRVHDMLKPNPAFQPDLGALLREVLQPYAARGAGALVCEGPDLEVPQNTAVMLSLVINELATNATKYGAWSNQRGRVQLTWSVVPGEDGDVVEMIWREEGGPPVTTPARKGFGSNVLKFSVERGLHGKFHAEYLPEGLSCTLTFPLSQTVQSAETDPAAIQSGNSV